MPNPPSHRPDQPGIHKAASTNGAAPPGTSSSGRPDTSPLRDNVLGARSLGDSSDMAMRRSADHGNAGRPSALHTVQRTIGHMNTSNGSILIVDGIESNRRELGRLLRSAGFDAIETGTLNDSRQQLEEHPPQMVIVSAEGIDPSFNDVYSRIRAIPGMASAPVLVISQSGYELDDHHARPDVDGYLSRSMEPEALIATVRAYLRVGRAEEAVRLSADQWQTTFDAINDGLAVLNLEGKVVRCNDAMVRMFDRQPEDIVGIPYYELFGISIQDIQDTPFIRMLHSRRRETLDLHHAGRWLHVTVDPLFAVDDALNGAVCIVADITSERDVEQKLEQRFEQLRTIYHLSHAVSRAEALEQIYTETFDSIERALGASRASILLLDPDGVMRFKAWKGISEGYRSMTEGHTPWTPETRNAQPIVVPDVVADESLGTLRETIVAEGIRALGFIPLTYQEKLLGKFMLYYDAPHSFSDEELNVARTIASHIALAIERRQSEEEMRLSEERLRLALDAARMGNWDWNLRTDSIVWSESLERIHGVRPDRLGTFESYLEMIHPNDRDEVAGTIRASIRNGASYAMEYRIERPNESLRWIEGKGRVFLDENGTATRLAGVCTDITDRKRFDAIRDTEYEVTRILAESETLEDAAQWILEVLCGSTDWTIGSIWSIDPSSNRLRHIDTWSDIPADRQQLVDFNNEFSFQIGSGLPGTVWHDRRAIWLTNLNEGDGLLRQQYLYDMGLQSGFGFPIMLGEEVLGVVECFSRAQRPPDDELLKMMTTIGSQIGQFIERKRAEAELKNSHNQMEVILRGVADGITAQDRTGHLIFANDAAARLTGFDSPEEFLATPGEEIMNRFELLDEFGSTLPLDRLPGRQAIRSKQRTEQIVRFRRKSTGVEEWSVTKSSPLLDEKGEVLYVINIFNNITERVHSAEELRISEARYRTLIEQSPMSIQIFTPNGFCIGANKSWEELWGISREALEGYNILQDRQIIDKGLMPYVERAFDGESVTIPPILYDPAEFNNDGGPRWVRSFLYAVKNDAGQIREVVLKLEDVTEWIEAEDALFATNQTLTALVDASPLAIAVLDPSGIVKLWNRAAEQIFGWEAEDVLGHPMPGIPGDRQQEFNDFNLRTLNDKIVTGAETVRRRRNGELLDVAIWTAPLRDPNGTPHAIMTVLADITDRRQAEMDRMELLAKEQATRRDAELARQRFAFLAEASELISSSLDFEKTIRQMAELAVPHVADWCSIDILTDDGSIEQLTVAHVDPRKVEWAYELRRENPIDPNSPTGVPNVIRTGKSEFLPEITDEMLVAAAKSPEHLALMREIGFTSVAIVPIRARGRTHGALTFVTTESGKHLDSADLTLAEDLARRVGIAIDNARLYREAQEEIAERKRTEAALRHSEELNRAVLNSMDAHISVLDSGGTIIAVNDAWERFALENGASPIMHTSIGENYIRICRGATGECSEEAMQVADALEKILRGKLNHFSIEYPCHSPQEKRWFLLTLTPLSRENGGAVVSHFNITGRKQAEDRIRDLLREVDLQRQRMNNLVASVPGVVWEARGTPDAADQRIDFVSDYAETMLGYSVEEWLSTPNFWLSIVHPDDRERAAIESTEIFLGKRTMNQFRWIAKDGRVVWVEARAVPIHDDEGRPIGMRGVTLDITERIIIEEKLREETETIDRVNRMGQMLSAELDLKKLVQGVTDAATELTGARFGSFFYNVQDNRGDSYMLYTLSGVPPEDFANFPMPHSTELFGPTFRGEEILRSDDVRQDPRYGRSAPYYGIPPGHLPVVSYLAVPVISRSGEVLGGLFFGHPSPGVFTEREERIVVGLAAQAAIAIDNARLIETAQQERAKVQKSEERYRDLVNGVDAIVWEGDPHTLRYTFVSRRAEHILGYPVREWTERSDFWSEIIHPDDRDQAVHRFHEAAEQGRQLAFEFRVIAADGRTVWLQDIVYVTKDSEGEPQQLRGLMVDITERKRAEEALRESEERFRTMADSAPVLLWIADDRNQGIYFNRGWIEFTGRSMGEELGEGWIQGIHPDDQARAIETCSQAFERREEFRMEFRLRRGDGVYRWVLDHAVPRFTPDGSFVGYIGSCIDITDLKEMEKALEQRVHERTSELEAANKELESFSYSVSHDLRAPLRSIDGFSKALLEDYTEQLDATGQNYLHRVRAASQRMGQLIDDMLNLSRVTRSELIREKVDLSQMARQIITELRNQEPERTVEVTIAPNITANGDVRLLHVVMENLLGNAWKFTGNTEAATIEFGIREEPDRTVYFVRDNGAGFDMEYADKLFVPFQRLHSIDQFQGTGVGLATVQRIIKRHGGTIWTEAKPNQGATFLFTL